MTRRPSKHLLLEIIEKSYRIGYGPKAVAKMTGYSERTVVGYAQMIGVKVGTTRPSMPVDPPPELLELLLRYRIGA